MNDYKQKNRIAVLTTPLGPDVVLFDQMTATEGLSECFSFAIDAVADKDVIDFTPALGKNCNVEVKTFNDLKRNFNGILVNTQWHGVGEGMFVYRLELRPWFWLLQFTTDMRFFQNKSVPDIIKEVFDGLGFSDYELKLSQSYDPLEYCVQFRETHYNFVSRLMEEYGIYYFFKHTSSKHIMVLADAPSAHEPIENGGDIPYYPQTGNYVRTSQHLHEWSSERMFRSGKVTLNDYDFEKPPADLKTSREGKESYQHSKLELYDFPGRYTERGLGESLAKVRLEAEQAMDHRRAGLGDAPSIYPGGKINLKNHPSKSENAEYMAVHASHSVVNSAYRSKSGATQDSYSGQYVFVPAAQVFRAPQHTRKPIVHGIQTAKVVGEDGEEITVDKHGRIKVQFPWDRNKKQSCWIRVGRVWSGKQWGDLFHPRHGQEVVIDFLEGDPDRPLVVGTVYNADNMPPYPLPSEKTKAGYKTNSTKGGGGFNEFHFEDKKDAEKIFMRAQKDLDVLVRNQETRTIGPVFPTPQGESSRATTLKFGDEELNVETGDRKVKIGHDEIVDIKNDQKITVHNTIAITATNKLTLTVGQSTIVMEPTKISISSTMIEVTSTASMKLSSLTLDSSSSATTTIDGGGLLNLSAGLVKIN
ncbi:type VI secretion system tip protein VgrG [Siculibacillus lacustris]|uniref:Type VI secretion system tip protein VgrG n=1 Tax=Siculibacillus lacustris TaxID=1549641 RepID=A0A4Q9VP59_9HYPH|nr:type VI secretion system tip protein TssI/VgrG [Siculibacillus lacustris]TBW36582.1 type VI secretion system tip protein VgrG [Siculibacillus lacustris]